MKKRTQYMAGLSLWISTLKSKEILKQVVLCSLEKECMGPTGSSLKCDYVIFKKKTFDSKKLKNFYLPPKIVS